MSLLRKSINPIEKVASVVDRFVFTKEEKAKFNGEMQKTIVGYAEKTFDGTTSRSKSRRYIAWLFSTIYAVILAVYLVCVFAQPEILPQLSELLRTSTPIIMAICFFYFGSYGIQGILKDRKNKN